MGERRNVGLPPKGGVSPGDEVGYIPWPAGIRVGGRCRQRPAAPPSGRREESRRDAVAEISKSKDYDREWAIKGFVAIALLESDEQTRCVAIRALARTGDPRATETTLTILNVDEYKPEEVWPPTALVRWDACVALADLSAAGQVPAEQRERVRETLMATERVYLMYEGKIRIEGQAAELAEDPEAREIYLGKNFRL